MSEQVISVSVTAAVFAGVITAFLPCTYPMLIGYIALLIGGGERERLVSRALLTTLWFFVGFTLVYMLFGGIAGLFGQFSGVALLVNSLKPALVTVGALFFIVVGFILLGVLSLPAKLKGIYSFRIPKALPVHSWWGALTIGAIFAAGWSPCVGPVLGGILVLSASSGSIVQGTFLMGAFALGIMLPFAALAVLYTRTARYLERAGKIIPFMRVLGGMLFILLGIFFLTGSTVFLVDVYPTGFFERYI